jgi:hypothetical protein
VDVASPGGWVSVLQAAKPAARPSAKSVEVKRTEKSTVRCIGCLPGGPRGVAGIAMSRTGYQGRGLLARRRQPAPPIRHSKGVSLIVVHETAIIACATQPMHWPEAL